MNSFVRGLHRLVWTPPERRWWGLSWFALIGFAVGSWFWTIEHRLVTGLSVFVGSMVVEAALFHLVIKKRRSRGAQ